MTGSEQAQAYPSTRDKVLAYILAHIDTHGVPPATRLVCLDLGMSKAVVCRATAKLVIERRLADEQRNPRAENTKRMAELHDLRAAGLSKSAIARHAGLSIRQIHRIIPLATAG